jgi:hypothetical protein
VSLPNSSGAAMWIEVEYNLSLTILSRTTPLGTGQAA